MEGVFEDLVSISETGGCAQCLSGDAEVPLHDSQAWRGQMPPCSAKTVGIGNNRPPLPHTSLRDKRPKARLATPSKHHEKSKDRAWSSLRGSARGLGSGSDFSFLTFSWNRDTCYSNMVRRQFMAKEKS